MEWWHDVFKVALSSVLGLFGMAIAWVMATVIRNRERIAVLENSLESLPKQVGELKQIIEDMRDERREDARQLYERVEAVRKELRDDIKDGDRRGRQR
jgi:cell division protein FtsB